MLNSPGDFGHGQCAHVSQDSSHLAPAEAVGGSRGRAKAVVAEHVEVAGHGVAAVPGAAAEEALGLHLGR